MSKGKSKHRVKGLAVFIVLLALVFGSYKVYKSGGSKDTQDTRTSDAIFNDTSWMYKTKLVMVGGGADKLAQIGQALNQATTEREVHSLESGSAGTYIVKVPNDALPELKTKLNSFGTRLSSETYTDSTLVSTNLEAENRRLESYQNEWNTLDAIRMRSEVENRRMDSLNRLISHTQDKIQRLEAADKTLLYVVVKPSGGNGGLTHQLKLFVMSFVYALIGLSLAVLIAYFGTRLLITLLAMLGVKGFGLDNILQNYSYGSYAKYGGYNSRYSYGYGGKNRKVKRVYKDSRSDSGDQKEESN